MCVCRSALMSYCAMLAIGRVSRQDWGGCWLRPSSGGMHGVLCPQGADFQGRSLKMIVSPRNVSSSHLLILTNNLTLHT